MKWNGGTEWKTQENDSTEQRMKTQQEESHNLEFVNGVHPTTRLHLRVPLQWVPIQLIASKWYIWFWNLCKSTSEVAE